MLKRILIIDGPLNGGGAERVLLDLLQHFDYTRHEVDLLLVHDKGTLQHQVPQQVNVISLWPDYTKGFSLAYHLYRDFGVKSLLRRRVIKALKGKSYDATISFLEGLPLLLHSLVPTAQAGKRLTWVHNDLFRYPYTDVQFYGDDQVDCYGMMDSIICVANDTKSAFDTRFTNLSQKTAVIYNPVDVDSIRAKAQPAVKNSRFTITVVGRLTEQKQPLRLINLAKRLNDNGYDFIIKVIGEGDLRQSLEKAISDTNLDERFCLSGFIENPYPEIAGADILLSVSGYEGFGLTICEAMCLGTPVVSTRTSGPIEIIDNDRYGLLCDHDDESIYQAVKRMIDDENLRLTYSAKALTRSDCFKPQHIINKIEQFIA